MASIRKLRNKARILAVQSLYQHSIDNSNTLDGLKIQFLAENDHIAFDTEHYAFILDQVFNSINKALDYIADNLPAIAINYPDGITTAIIKSAFVELEQCLDVPYPVVIDEYVIIAKKYGAEGSYKLINSVVEQLAQKLRATEFNTRNGI